MKSVRMLIAGSAVLALSACVAYIPTGPEPAYAYSYAAPYYYDVGPAYVWTPGYWHWGGVSYTWRSGRWDRPSHGYHRDGRSGHWTRDGRGNDGRGRGERGGQRGRPGL